MCVHLLCVWMCVWLCKDMFEDVCEVQRLTLDILLYHSLPYSLIGPGMNGWLDVLESKLWAYIWLLPRRAGDLVNSPVPSSSVGSGSLSSGPHSLTEPRPHVLYSFSHSEDFLFLICVNIWLHRYRSIICMPGTWGVQKTVLYSLELELQIAVSHRESFANWTQFLYKSSKRS